MEKEKIVIFGAGGSGREILWYILDINAKKKCFDILGFVDDTPELQNKIINGYPVLGDTSFLLNYDGEINICLAVTSPKARKQIYNRFSHKQNFSFPNIIVEDVRYFPETFANVKGCVIGYHCLISVDVFMGDFVFMNACCVIGHDAKIGDFSTLYGGVHISGNVSVGECAQIGNGARILQNISIGENSVVGIGSVVIRNVSPNATVFGNPAKLIY
ncbi:MAG: acetyltransferase [Chitinivibrionia bacterium]|nr:acetyltransferase [Chitinivibrionia bacterium]